MIGFFDSGIGGLTVFRRVAKTLKKSDVMYLADSAYFPYGSLSKKEVLIRTIKGCEFLFQKGCGLVIISCHTASILSQPELLQWQQQNYPDRVIIDMSQSTVDFVVNHYLHFQNTKGLFMMTPACLETNFYQTKLQAAGFDHIEYIGNKDLAKAIENNDKMFLKQVIHYDIRSQLQHDISEYKFMVFGCTHYPIAKKEFRTFINQELEFIDPSFEIAKKSAVVFFKHPGLITTGTSDQFFTTGDAKELDRKVNSVINWVVTSQTIQL
jgi:glutamate racemase